VTREQTEQVGAKGKYYATTTVPDKGCYFRRDYSFINYPNDCMGCEFCYKKKDEIRKQKPKTFLYFLREKIFSKHMYDTPIIMSRFCDPMYNWGATQHSFLVARNIIENNGQFILKTANHNIYHCFTDLMEANKKDTQLQLRFVSDDSILGENLRNRIAPKFSPSTKLLDTAYKISSLGIDVAAIYDPFIAGVNGGNLIRLMPQFEDHGITKLIVKQLFPTKYFLETLKTFATPRYTKFQEISGDHFVYDNIMLLESLVSVIEAAEKHNISMSVCSNRHINDLIFTGNNCCQFKYPKLNYMELDKIMKQKRDEKRSREK
jgi:DNA repair photolyase